MYERYYELYMKNMITLTTLEKLVAARKLTRDEVDGVVKKRFEKYGY